MFIREARALEKEVCKSRTFVLGPSQDYFCGTDGEFRNLAVLSLINPDCNNSFQFSLTNLTD